jgi:hypothetical protein
VVATGRAADCPVDADGGGGVEAKALGAEYEDFLNLGHQSLDGLERIPWKNLTHAYGSADDVPELLRALRTASQDEQGDGTPLYELYGNIWHQGTVYEATAYAVPFLIELATDPQTPDREGILNLLADIAKSSSLFRSVHGNLLREPGYEVKKAREQTWAVNAHEAVAVGFDSFVAVTMESGQVRFAAAHVLAQLTSNAEKVAAIICAMLDNEQHELFRAGLLLLLGQAGDRSHVTLAALTRAVADSDQTQRLAAGCSLSMLKPVPLSNFAREAIMEAILTTDFEERFDGLPWDAQGEIACAADNLPKCLDSSEIEFVAAQILSAIESGSADQQQVGKLINMLFPVTRGPTHQLRASDLSPLQHRAVRVLAAAMDGGRRIFYGHFPCWGLPDTMREWQALAAGVDAPEIDMSLPLLADPANPFRTLNLRLIRPGATVAHRHFGKGTVTLVEHKDNGWTRLGVMFDEEGPKELSFPSDL